MSHLSKKQKTFGSVLTMALNHSADDDPKDKHPYAVVDSYHIEFTGTPEAFLKAVSGLPMVESVFVMKITGEISNE